MIKVNNISKSYNNKSILKNVNLTCEEGKIYALVGSNGAGKTVLYSTHNLDTVSRFCDEVIILGKTHEVYPISNMEDADILENIFFEKCI